MRTARQEARQAAYRALVSEGCGVAEIAARMGVTERSARNYLNLHHLRRRAELITAAEWAWAVRAIEEGVPLRWVADTLEVSAREVGRRWRREALRPPPSASQFSAVWSQIRHHPRLRELHDEFAPKGRS